MSDEFVGILRNRETGEMHAIDAHKARLGRMRRRIHSWSEVADEIDKTKQTRKIMVDLTYRPGVEWEANHIRDYMSAVRRKLGDDLYAYAWVAEMQMRGSVHYHIYIIAKKGVRLPVPDKSGMWPNGMSRIAKGRSPFYLVSYLKKDNQEKAYQKKGFIKGMRIFAVWIKKDVVRKWIWTKFRWSALPAWLRQELEQFGIVLVGLFPKRKEGGGWSLRLPKERQELINWPEWDIEFHSPWTLD